MDYPLGHTSGKPLAPDDQLGVLRAALKLLEQNELIPGHIEHLPNEWSSDHTWKDRVMRPRHVKGTTEQTKTESHADDRVERFDTPQYQSAEDAASVDADCPTCVFLED